MGGSDGRTKRLFIAIPLPDAAVEVTMKMQEQLRNEDGLRLVPRGQLHCTLAFIGQVGSVKECRASEVVAGLKDDLGGQAAIGGLLYLPNLRRPNVIALGIDDPAGVVTRVFEAVMGGLEAEDVMRRDSRPFRPHVTIARMRGSRRIQPMSDCERFVFGVESVCLYESELKREGAVHSVLERKHLQKAYGQLKA